MASRLTSLRAFRGRHLTIAAVLAFLTVGLSCDDKSAPTAPTTGTPVAPVTSVGLKILGPTASIGVSQTVFLRAAELMSNGGTHPVEGGVVWSSSSPEVATVSATGSLVALTPGTTIVTASYIAYTATLTIRVAANWADLDFRVAILNASSSAKPTADVMRVFDVANGLLFERTGARMRLIDMRDALPDTPSRIATIYFESSPPEQPDGLIIWSEDATAVSFGGYSQAILRPAPFSNRFPATSGSNRLFVSSIHYDHKYGRCGYDTTGGIRISDKSANGECRNRSGLMCVDNGRFWECPDVRENLYAQPDMFLASTIVHEFMHPVGLAGNDDHYSTSTCIARAGMTPSQGSDLARSQWHMGMCPDVFLRFRPAGVPNVNRR